MIMEKRVAHYNSTLQEFFDAHKDLPWTDCSDEGIIFHIARRTEYTKSSREKPHLAIEQTPPDWFTKQFGLEAFVGAYVRYKPSGIAIDYKNHTSLHLSSTEYGTIMRKVCFSLEEALDLLLHYHIISDS